MKHGHTTGLKRERTGATPHFDALQAEHLARIEREYAAPATAPATTVATLPEPSTPVIPVALAEDGYRDWEVTVATVDGEQQYLIINDGGMDGDWELRERRHNGWQNDWQLVAVGMEVTAFLTQHSLTLQQ